MTRSCGSVLKSIHNNLGMNGLFVSAAPVPLLSPATGNQLSQVSYWLLPCIILVSGKSVMTSCIASSSAPVSFRTSMMYWSISRYCWGLCLNIWLFLRRPAAGIVPGEGVLDVVWSYSDSLAEEILHSSSLIRELRSGHLTERCYTTFTQQEALYLHRVACTLKVCVSSGAGLLSWLPVTSLISVSVSDVSFEYSVGFFQALQLNCR